MDPLILHVDMDAFFVSVEELFRPELKGKAVIVGGEPDQRGVVAAASYEARKFGVHSAMPLTTAKSLCPHAIFLHGHREKYQEYSGQIHTIFSRYTPVVEMASIDEAYLDLSGSERLFGNSFHLAHSLRSEILRQTGLSASIGISRSRLVSKVASDLAKPAGILHVWPGREPIFLAPLPIRKLPGVGRKTEAHLHALGIMLVGDLARAGREYLVRSFGLWGESLYRKSQGLETAHFEFHEEPKSISHETTFDQDTSDPGILQKTLGGLVQKVAHRLREHRMYAKTVTVKIRDFQFRTVTRAGSLKQATHLDEEILKLASCMFAEYWDGQRKIRLLGVVLSNLSFSLFQEPLFEKSHRDRLGRLYEAADKIREKFGFNSISSARTIR
ncbi:MAG TPA: DNA polymerase IV [Terriglobia bacterium]|nr:DNA polymerase IV [Terriglobia bacterium]